MLADNAQISKRQLFRQIFTALIGIYFLAVPMMPHLRGRQGILSLLLGMALYLFLCIYFIRIKTVFQNPERYMGKITGTIFVLLYLSWLWLMGVYLLLIIAGITERFLIEGSSSWIIILLAGTASYIGSHQGLERRARMAEVCFPILLVLLAGLLFFVIPQVKHPYILDMGSISPRGLAEGTYEVLCIYLPFVFLPITLGNVKKAGETGNVMAGAIGLLTGLQVFSLLLLQGRFGIGGYEHKEYPMIDLMAGIRFPGDFVERADIFWVAAVMFSVFFALGSVFFYNHELLARVKLEKAAVFPAMGILFAAEVCKRADVSPEIFRWLTAKIYAPLLFVLLLYAGISGKKKRVVTKAVSLFLCLLCLNGCGVSLENRVFPLAMSADYVNGNYEIIYGIPGLSQATGQNKTETSGEQPQAIVYRGIKPGDAKEKFDENQEKYLDMGHMKALILGNGILGNRKKLDEFLVYLEEKPSVGANIYVFACDDVNALMSLDSTGNKSLGDYLKGILENNLEGREKNAVTLQDLYNACHREEEMPILPKVTIMNKLPKVRQYS